MKRFVLVIALSIMGMLSAQDQGSGWENGKNSRDIISCGHIDIMHNAKASVLIVKEQNIDLMFRQAWTADTVSRL